jgi:hypothetical protein
VTELHQLGFLELTGAQRDSVLHRPADVWRITPAGLKAHLSPDPLPRIPREKKGAAA